MGTYCSRFLRKYNLLGEIQIGITVLSCLQKIWQNKVVKTTFIYLLLYVRCLPLLTISCSMPVVFLSY